MLPKPENPAFQMIGLESIFENGTLCIYLLKLKKIQ